VGENDFFIPSMDLASEHGVAPVPYFLQFGTTPTVVRTSSKSQKVHLELLLAQRCGCPNTEKLKRPEPRQVKLNVDATFFSD
jgi:hypothetical protein